MRRGHHRSRTRSDADEVAQADDVTDADRITSTDGAGAGAHVDRHHRDVTVDIIAGTERLRFRQGGRRSSNAG